mgnify:FL=1
MSTLELKELSHPAGQVIKIASGKTLDLHAQGTTKMPAGSVIQVIQTYNPSQAGHAATTANSWNATGIIAEITPKYVGSKILVSWSNTMSKSSDWGMQRMYYKVGSGSYAVMPSTGQYHVGYSEVNKNSYAPHVMNANYVTTSLSTLCFQTYVYSGGGTYTYLHADSSYALTLMEVAQ